MIMFTGSKYTFDMDSLKYWEFHRTAAVSRGMSIGASRSKLKPAGSWGRGESLELVAGGTLALFWSMTKSCFRAQVTKMKN